MTHIPVFRPFLLLLALGAALLVADDARAQAVSGLITAAEDGAAVSGARVLLLDEGGARVLDTDATDAVGRYTLQAPEGGRYLVMVEREGYANQVSSLLEVAAGETISFDLSMTVQRVGQTGVVADTLDDATLLSLAIAEVCQGTFVPGMHGIIFGAVRNQADSDPLPFVQVEARWEERGMGTKRLTTRSDESGAYVICDIPAGQRVQVRALDQETDVNGRDRDVTLRAGTMRKLDVGIPLSDPTAPGNLLGRVTNESGVPLVGAEVRLLGTGRTEATNERGVFTMENVPAGTEVMEAEMLGYAVQRDAVRVIGGRAQEVTIRLSVEPVQLAPMTVTVRPRTWFIDRQGLEHRIAVGTGYIMLREEIEERSAAVLGELLRNVPGVRVRAGGGGVSRRYVVQLRGAANLANDVCQPVVWVDGVKWGTDGSAFSEVMAFEIEAVEVYRGPSEVPGEFSSQDDRCGVVVVWTRRGSRIGE